MTECIQPILDRSQAWQLLALAFAHPVPELYEQLADGRFPEAFDRALACGYGDSIGLPRATTSFREFEAQYIALFDMGPKGRALVPLCAGGYESLLGGEGRPRLMLQYAGFYRHFGLRTHEGGVEQEMPDHLTCQLECLAWLGHLEGHALGRDDELRGYRQARHDFIVRLLEPQCRLLAPRLSATCEERGYDPLFAALGNALERLWALDLAHLQSTLDAAAPSPPIASVGSVSAQHLWG